MKFFLVNHMLWSLQFLMPENAKAVLKSQNMTFTILKCIILQTVGKSSGAGTRGFGTTWGQA